MATYDIQQRVKLIEFYYSSERSIIQTQRKSPQHFNVRVSFSDSMIWNLITKFERTGSVRDLTGRGLKRTVRINAAVEAAGQLALLWKKML